MNSKKRVIVGMSGGVDSSVSAYLLKEAGYDVVGLFMKNWEEEGECQAAVDFQDVAAVAGALDIPYYSVNFSKEYYERVFARALVEFKAGRTPNPDILCNQEIKFKLFFDKALELDADLIATGHYARVLLRDGKAALGRGEDPSKDQSYFLYTLKSEKLSRLLFPIGEITKARVRDIARKMKLATAEKKDSTGICFIGKRDFREFLSHYIPQKSGSICTLEGKEVGQHTGVFYYTIGQRHGLGIGGEGLPWYVVGKDVAKNILFVVQGEDHPALYSSGLIGSEESWVVAPPELPKKLTAKIRYRAIDLPCFVQRTEDGMLKVTFEQPVKAITPGQSVVFYDDEECLGGAIIIEAIKREVK